MSAPATGPAAKYVQPSEIDCKALLGDPPADDSPQHKAEIDLLLSLQADRTPEEVKRCKAEEMVTVFAFADVLGPGFKAKNLPITAKLMQQAFVDARLASDTPKKAWARPRPYISDPRIKPCTSLESTFSYPSGHATRGAMWAALLAEVFPQKREALLARGKQIGTDRLIAGMHWPSDVDAGRKLGEEVARKLLVNPDFQVEFEKAKVEMLGHR